MADITVSSAPVLARSPANMTGRPAIAIRTATAADRSDILALQHLSLRALGRAFYNERQIESYLRHVPTLEDYLLDDASYFVLYEREELAACGGWSLRAPAYGALVHGSAEQPQRNLPKVRAMFVHPDCARRGHGRRVLEAIEAAIVGAGYDEAVVDATLGGVLLYERCGYIPDGETEAQLPDGCRMRFVSMHKHLSRAERPDAER